MKEAKMDSYEREIGVPQGIVTYRVTNIEEAIELANQMKVEGRYNWFRGHVQAWPPYPSMGRVWASGDAERKERVTQRQIMFYNWVGLIQKLQFLQKREYDHDYFAIMQHYGIPTFYIDFTTDPGVAGFFAADTKEPPIEGQSCIYCLDTDELMSVWEIAKKFVPEGSILELVEIDVENLWRLQSQRGVFLFTNFNWDMVYPMDRILFPYSGYPSYPTRERIYPEHKSPLEQLLDQFFFLESANEGAKLMKQMSEEMGINYYTVEEGPPEGFYPDSVIDSASVTPLASWSSEALRAWQIVPQEDYYQTMGPSLKLQLQPNASTEEIRRSVSFGVKQILRSDATLRSKAVDWVFSGLPDSLANEKLRPVWDGMRRLPYTDEEIADALSTVTALLILGIREEISPSNEIEMFEQCFGECMRIEFAHQDGSGTRGLAALESLRRALRSDMAELLLPEYRERIYNIHDLFFGIHSPRLMFEFEEFKSMFAREIIPSQILLGRDLLLFNPAQLKVLGLP